MLWQCQNFLNFQGWIMVHRPFSLSISPLVDTYVDYISWPLWQCFASQLTTIVLGSFALLVKLSLCVLSTICKTPSSLVCWPHGLHWIWFLKWLGLCPYLFYFFSLFPIVFFPTTPFCFHFFLFLLTFLWFHFVFFLCLLVVPLWFAIFYAG
jgi:hypothetical protein